MVAKSSGSSIVAKCALVLDVLAASRSPMTFSQIAERTGFVKSSCHRILAVLVCEKLVAYDQDTRRYVTGQRLSDWSRLAWRRVDLQEVASAEMHTLSERLQINVALSVLDQLMLLYLRTVDYDPLRYAAAMGDHAPLHCTAAGKVFLAFMPDARRDRILSELPFEKMTPQTLSDPKDLVANLSTVKTMGYGLADQEEFPSVYGVAAPIFDEGGSVAACLSVWRSSTEPNAIQDLSGHASDVKASAQRVSQMLGWRDS